MPKRRGVSKKNASTTLVSAGCSICAGYFLRNNRKRAGGLGQLPRQLLIFQQPRRQGLTLPLPRMQVQTGGKSISQIHSM